MASTEDHFDQHSNDLTPESPRFPKGYGDFTFKSSDNVIFSFPGGVLAHVSPVFNDMFLSGTSSEASSQSTLQLQEDSETITQLLHHIDPLLQPLPIEKATLRRLLEAARKYQIPKVLRWVESETLDKRISLVESPEPLRISHPLFYLSLGCEFESKEMVRQGMREAIRCHISKLAKKEPVALDIFQQILVLRGQRSAMLNCEFLGVIIRIAQELDIGKDFDLGVNSYRGLLSSRKDMPRPKPCERCLVCLRGGIKAVSMVSIAYPAVAVVDKEFKERTNHRCSTCGVNIYQAIWEHQSHTIAPHGGLMGRIKDIHKTSYQETLKILLEKENEILDFQF
jgi:hypothetical protein